MKGSHTAIRSRRVAVELRKLREKAELTCAEAGEKLGMSASKISRIETAVSGIEVEDLAALLGLYQVPERKRREVIRWLRAADRGGWWRRQPGLPTLWRSLIEFEARACHLRCYEAMFVPGLLQTADYARAVLRGINGALSDRQLDTLVASRMARQAVLSRTDAPILVTLLDEGALRRPVGGEEVMSRQLRYLLEAAQRPNVLLRVVPLAAGAYAGFRGPFMILEFEGEPDLVYVENQSTGLFLEEDSDHSSYREALSNILRVALAPTETAELISALVEQG
ncbi:transcriptional regulator [Longimycelium tulufanense]|uniref:Transcriptional regulator n=1 Tax=Longimycelium tulufanense TaxID=907463 RepID=A0A8J3FWS8_9PSEU|nr:helix-turn-helix transcriptional regulator [Longimycelium tulufanense]GGM69045.1 transcriptional regulator [Longimycelium tulufanense]